MRNGVENGSFGSSPDSFEIVKRGNRAKRAASVPTTVARPISSFPRRKCLLVCLTMGLALRLLRRAGFDHDTEFTAAKRSLIQVDDLRNSCTPKFGESPRSASSLGMTILIGCSLTRRAWRAPYRFRR